MEEPTLSPLSTPERESNMLPIILGVGFVLVVVGVIVFFLRSHPKTVPTINPYATNLKLSDIKMSTAQNFVGSTVTYIDGTGTNSGDKTVTRLIVHIVFRDSMGQVAQAEDLPLKVLQNTGPYLDTADLSSSPLGPGQSKPFRLVFEHVSAEWNQAYPEIQVTDLTAK
jgi:hypothetical protein